MIVTLVLRDGRIVKGRVVLWQSCLKQDARDLIELETPTEAIVLQGYNLYDRTLLADSLVLYEGEDFQISRTSIISLPRE